MFQLQVSLRGFASFRHGTVYLRPEVTFILSPLVLLAGFILPTNIALQSLFTATRALLLYSLQTVDAAASEPAAKAGAAESKSALSSDPLQQLYSAVAALFPICTGEHATYTPHLTVGKWNEVSGFLDGLCYWCS